MLDLWYATYQNDCTKPEERFNKNFIYGRGKEENLKNILSAISRAMEVTGFVKFTGCDIEEDESKFSDLHKIEESRLIQAVLNFHLCCTEPDGEKEEDISVRVFLPKVVDDFFFILNGVKYYAIYQMIDKGTYTVGENIGLKTMLMPFLIKKNDAVIVDKDNNEYKGRMMELDVFRRSVNIMLYFISETGIDETLKFFNANQYIHIFSEDAEIDKEKFVRFNFGKFDMAIDREFFAEDKWITFTLLSLFTKSKISSAEDLVSPEFWNHQLGKIYTANKDQAVKKAEKIHSSVRRILDDCTKQNMVHIDEKDKKSVYHIFRWILVFYDKLVKEDSMDLKNKRLRLNEYILYPLIRKLSTETYRCLNTRKMTMRILTSMFSNIKANICIKQLITSELLRYVNCVNCIDIFSAGLKISQNGPQGLSSSNNVPIRYRGHHPSYIGQIGLNAASAGDPGMTATLTPFVKIDGLFFDKTPSYKTDGYPDELHIYGMNPVKEEEEVVNANTI
jgi:hypothetical protein